MYNSAINFERWLPVKDFEGYYEASSMGAIRPVVPRYKTSQVLKQGDNGNGHMIVTLVKDGVKYPSKQVSHLVYEAFYGEIPAKHVIDHINENPRDNRITNLQAITQHQNVLRGTGVERMAYEHRKPVKAYQDGVEIGHFNSIKEASLLTGLNSSEIGKCAAGKRNEVGGYKWLYAEHKEPKPKKLCER